jgi:hypothetical protein
LGAKSEPTITQTIKHQGSSHPVNMNFLDRYIVFSSKGRVYYFRKLRQKVVTYQPLCAFAKAENRCSSLLFTHRKSGNWYYNRKSDAQREKNRPALIVAQRRQVKIPMVWSKYSASARLPIV